MVDTQAEGGSGWVDIYRSLHIQTTYIYVYVIGTRFGVLCVFVFLFAMRSTLFNIHVVLEASTLRSLTNCRQYQRSILRKFSIYGIADLCSGTSHVEPLSAAARALRVIQFCCAAVWDTIYA